MCGAVLHLPPGITERCEPHLPVRVEGEVSQQFVSHAGQVTRYSL